MILCVKHFVDKYTMGTKADIERIKAEDERVKRLLERENSDMTRL